MTGITQVIANGGVMPQQFYNQTSSNNNFVSVRKKGLKQGGKILLRNHDCSDFGDFDGNDPD